MATPRNRSPAHSLSHPLFVFTLRKKTLVAASRAQQSLSVCLSILIIHIHLNPSWLHSACKLLVSVRDAVGPQSTHNLVALFRIPPPPATSPGISSPMLEMAFLTNVYKMSSWIGTALCNEPSRYPRARCLTKLYAMQTYEGVEV
jgi:hypothetical protein